VTQSVAIIVVQEVKPLDHMVKIDVCGAILAVILVDVAVVEEEDAVVHVI
jgi:hypothetical protein